MRHLESEEQQKFFARAAYHRYNEGYLREYMWSVPNALGASGKRAMLQMLRLRREGLTPGQPDIECAIAVPPYTGLHIELKKPDGKPSDVSDAQKKQMAMLTRCGRRCVVAYGADEAWDATMNYLKGA